MTCRYNVAVFAAFTLITFSASLADAQSKTGWGDPDLQGVWHSSGAVPMERPNEYQGRTLLTGPKCS